MANVRTLEDAGAQTMARYKQTALNNKKRSAARKRISPAIVQKTNGALRNAYRENIRKRNQYEK